MELLLASVPGDLKAELPLAVMPQDACVSWKDIADILAALYKPLRADEWPDEYCKAWHHIVALCQSRCEVEEKAQKVLLSEHAVTLWNSVGHLHSRAVRRRLQHWLNEKSLSNTLRCDGYTSLFGRWRGLIEAVRSVAELEPYDSDHPNAQDWESVLLFMIQHKNLPDAECDIFGKCELCWRFVPLVGETGQHHLYCSDHPWNSREYKRALRVQASFAAVGETFTEAASRLQKQTYQHWIAYHQNLPENWIPLFSKDVVTLAQSVTQKMEYHPGLIARYFPHVCHYVRKAGGESTPRDIVTTLDPIPDDAPPHIRERWEALHHVFIHNLALYRRELCEAEIFLSRYETLFANVKRGGARPRKQR